VLEQPKVSSGGGGSQAMADANAAVNPPKPDLTSMAELIQDANKNVNRKFAHTWFDGSCLKTQD